MIEGFSSSAQNVGGGAVVPNNSGQGAGTQPPAEVLTGFNWGAFLLNWIWGCGNNTFITRKYVFNRIFNRNYML